MSFTNVLTVILLILLFATVIVAAVKIRQGNRTDLDHPALAATSIYEFKLADIDGDELSLEAFKGEVLLLVNVASKCGYTYQYEALQELHKKYADKGFKVLGFPANNFMGQEPGSNEEIKSFCTEKYDVSFPMFSKISVKGKDKYPLYVYLTSKTLHPETGGEITWNFNKFLVDRSGKVIARFGTKVEPMSAELTTALENAIK